MTADIRAAALAEARGADLHHELSSAHYTRVFTAGAAWAVERVTPTREQIAEVIDRVDDSSWRNIFPEERDEIARAVHALFGEVVGDE